MDCNAFKELAPAMALGALDESDRVACAAHLADAGPHDGCREAHAAALAVAARLSDLLPDHPVNPRVWRAIEERVAAVPVTTPASTPPPARARRARGRWRELAGWVVAAVVVGVHLTRTPVDRARETGARTAASLLATPPTPPALKSALTLMMGPNTRRYVFQSNPPGTARATLILDPGLRSAVVLADHVVLAPEDGLRLWAVRAQRGAPSFLALARLGIDGGGAAAAEIGPALFEPSLPGALWLSADPPDAAAPRSVLLVANLGDQPGD